MTQAADQSERFPSRALAMWENSVVPIEQPKSNFFLIVIVAVIFAVVFFYRCLHHGFNLLASSRQGNDGQVQGLIRGCSCISLQSH